MYNHAGAHSTRRVQIHWRSKQNDTPFVRQPLKELSTQRLGTTQSLDAKTHATVVSAVTRRNRLSADAR